MKHAAAISTVASPYPFRGTVSGSPAIAEMSCSTANQCTEKAPPSASGASLSQCPARGRAEVMGAAPWRRPIAKSHPLSARELHTDAIKPAPSRDATPNIAIHLQIELLRKTISVGDQK